MQNFNFKTRKMMNQATAELFHTTAYVEDYLDCIESLPNDLQRSVSEMREVDSVYRLVLKQTKQYYKDLIATSSDSPARKKVMFNLQRCLLKTQELGDEKLHLSNQIVEMVENRLRQMEVNKNHVELSEKPKLLVENNKDKLAKLKREAELHALDKTNKRPRRHRVEKEKEKDVIVTTTSTNKENGTKNKKKKRMKTKIERAPSPIDIPIDPNEPTYCLCNQVSYGEMVGCDNKDCPFEWFHFGCVGLTHKPKGKWYCPKCLPEVKKK